MQIDIDALTPEVMSELRVLVNSPGWKVFEDLISAQRFIQYERNLKDVPDAGEDLSMFALRNYGANQYHLGLAFAMEFPKTLIENYSTDEAEEDKDE